jgi:RNA polymerase sigma-70 factor (ECF subfamily)
VRTGIWVFSQSNGSSNKMMPLAQLCADGPPARSDTSRPFARFDDIVRTYRRMLVLAAYRITLNIEDAHDVAQFAFMQLHRKWPAFEDRRALERWLYVVVRNEALNVRRSRQRDAHAAESSRDPLISSGFEDTVMRDEVGEAVRATIALLPAAQREVIELRHLQAMPVAEIANQLGVPLRRVKQDVERAHIRLRVEMQRRGLHDDVQ